MTAPLLIPLVMMGCFIALGVFFSKGRCSFLIGGDHLLPREKKEQYDERALCRFTGRLMYFLAFCMLLWLVGIILQSSILQAALPLFFVAGITSAIIYANTGGRFRK